jgi:hypothetical protein
MKRLLVIILILIAIPLWVWNTNLLLTGALGHKKHLKNAAKAVMTGTHPGGNAAMSAHFEPKGRSPFTPYKEATKPKASANTLKKNVSLPSARVPSNPPPISINSIMWNESNPVAIINLQDGSSTIAKKGQTLAGGIVVKAIEKNQIQVEFNGNTFVIKK